MNPAVNLRDPDLIKDVLIKDHFNFHANEQNFNRHFDSLMMYNPFVATNDSWRKGRTVLTPLLTLFKVKQFKNREKQQNPYSAFSIGTVIASTHRRFL